jgi:hypothetical protein
MKKQSKFLLGVCAAILFSLPSMAAETQLVTATGYGMSVEEAKRAAVRSAVEAVVGTMVDAETLVKNDELVEDKILSYSAGMVENVEFIGEPKQDSAGLVKVHVQVTVRKTELAERLKAVTRASAEVDGESLYRQVLAERQKAQFNQQNLEEAGKIMQNLFGPDRLEGLIKFEPDAENNGSPIALNPKTGRVSVSVKGGVDLAVYKRFTDEVIEKLEPMATNKVAGTPRGIKITKDGSFAISQEGRIGIGGGQGVSILRNARSMEAVGLKFDKDKWRLLRAQLKRLNKYAFVVSVSLLDRMGEKIKSTEFQIHVLVPETDGEYYLDRYGFHHAKSEEEIKIRQNNLIMIPACQAGKANWTPVVRKNISFGVLQPEDLREIASVVVEVALPSR